MAFMLGQDYGSRNESFTAMSLLFSIMVVGMAYVVSSAIYSIFVSPLRHIPGPKLWAVTTIPYNRTILAGQGHIRMLSLHQKYGDAVRIGPNQVSMLNSQAWKDTMGHRKAGGLENEKDPAYYYALKDGIMGAKADDHKRIRRTLAPAFTAQNLLNQQFLITQYVDLLFLRLKEVAGDGVQGIDIAKWYSWTTFDIIGDLVFGESFRCLETSSPHPWITLVFGSLKQLLIMGLIRRVWPWIDHIPLFRHYIAKKRVQIVDYTRNQVEKRLCFETSRPDFMEAMTAKNEDGEMMTMSEIRSTAGTLISAGSETVATTLAGATFLLCTHPDILTKLSSEVLSHFASEEEITLSSVQGLDYTLAVVNETLRLYPPVPGALPRVVHHGGEVICGRYLPAGSLVNIWQWAMYHDANHFAEPDSFIPERWLGDERFTNDNKEAFQPFSFGARNCPGKIIAYAEMRLILAKLVWNFDVKLDSDSYNWMKTQKSGLLWERDLLNVSLVLRNIDDRH